VTLEDEPTTESTDQTAGTPAATGQAAGGDAPPAKKAARKRATRKTAAPASSPAQADNAADGGPADAPADPPPVQVLPADDGDAVEVAAPARKRTSRRTAKKTAAASVEPPSGQDDATTGAGSDGPTTPQPDGPPAAADELGPDAAAAPARKRSRSRKKAASAHPEVVAAGVEDVVAPAAAGPAADQSADQAADPTDEDELAAAEAAAAEAAETEQPAALAPLFQAPAPRRRRAASRPAGPPQPHDDAPDPVAGEAPAAATQPDPARGEDVRPDDAASADEPREGTGGRGGRSRRRRGGRQAAAEQAAEATDEVVEQVPAQDDDADEDAGSDAGPDELGDDTDDQAGGRRRRRRGGRGRRRRGGEDDADTDAEAEGGQGADEPSDAEDTDAEPQAADDEGDPSSDEAGDEGGSRRRRRRRRRSGGGDDTGSAEDDPPNTVVRVRQSRAGKETSRDEVTGVRGSTRLEAKRQRRREGRESGRRKPVITESEFLARREAVARTMLVRDREGRTQIVVLEDGVLVEHYVARKASASMIGNVYVGKVQNVLPSMEAAFVDIGKGRNAVLYAGEVNWDAAGLEGQPRRIELALKSGDPVLVQVSKDPVGHKGARLTSQVSLPGRYLVYVPNSSMTGISRKLPDKERARLKKILKAVVPDHAGVIVRTAAEGASEVELERDVQRLQKLWETIEKRSKAANPPNLLHGEPDLTVKVVRDVFNEDFTNLVVSGDEAWETVKGYVDEVAPDLSDRVSRWDGDGDVFAAHQVDEQIAKALERKVFLPSGGSLVIDRTEAMTVVDVNTGKFVGSGGNLEETVTRNNLEAAEEIVRQLRLRDVGGIIVIDFIDMVLESNRDLVMRRLTECLGRDRTKHQVAEVTSLGLVQMTRKRVGQGLLEAFSEPCEHCQGRGVTLYDEPVERKGGGEGRPAEGKGNGGGRGNGGGGAKGGAKNGDDALTEAQREQQRRASAEAQKVHEAARKAMERAKEKEAAGADATVVAEEALDVADAGLAGVEAVVTTATTDTTPADVPTDVPADVPVEAPAEVGADLPAEPVVEAAPGAEVPAPQDLEPVPAPVEDATAAPTEAPSEVASVAPSAAPARRRRRRATSPATAPTPQE
jgi:ribonuclease E